MEITLYLNQHIDIKSIIESIRINTNSTYKTHLQRFKDLALKQHKLKEAFNTLLPDKTQQHILSHAITSKQLEKGLNVIATSYKHHFLDRLKTTLSRISTCLLILTGTTVFAGFYLTLLPLQYLVESL